jgi:HAD superfamily hydrolase (TIGR01484 family)
MTEFIPEKGIGGNKIESFYQNPPEILQNPSFTVFIDVDGVVGRELPPYEQGQLTELQEKQLRDLGVVIERLQEIGVACIPCTGRSAETLCAKRNNSKSILDLLGTGFALCENGGVLAVNSGEDIFITISSEKQSLLGEIKDKFENENLLAKRTMVTIQFPLGKTDEQRCQLAEEIEKLLDDDLKKRMEEAGIEWGASAHAYDFSPIDKAGGVEQFCEKLGIDLDQTLAIGDSGGDIPMMNVCKYAACPANASEEVKICIEDKESNGFIAVEGFNTATGALKILTLTGKAFKQEKSLEEVFTNVKQSQQVVKGRERFETKYQKQLGELGNS